MNIKVTAFTESKTFFYTHVFYVRGLVKNNWALPHNIWIK